MPTEEELNQEQAEEGEKMRIRGALVAAYSFVRGQESVHSFAAFTYEEAIDAQIERLDGKGTDIRPNEKTRVAIAFNNLVAALQDIAEYEGAYVEEDERANTE